MTEHSCALRWSIAPLLLAGVLAASFVLPWFAVASGASKAKREAPSRHLDLAQPAVRAVLQRFAQNPSTSFDEVEALLRYDVDAGLLVVSDPSFHGEYLPRCGDVVRGLPDLGDSRALLIADIYHKWAKMHPKTFRLNEDDITRRVVLADMLKQAKGADAKKKIQRFIDTLEGDGTSITGSTPPGLEVDPSLERRK